MNMPSVMAAKPTQVLTAARPSSGADGHLPSAAASARMRIHSTAALSSEKTMPYQTSPKTSGSTRISAGDDAVVGMRHEAVGPALRPAARRAAR